MTKKLVVMSVTSYATQSETRACLLESSRIPANAEYHAKNALQIPNAPPVLIRLGPGAPAAFGLSQPRARKRKARSSVKKSRKKATVDRSVARRRRVVKINHPCHG